jgi:hypothetical protein
MFINAMERVNENERFVVKLEINVGTRDTAADEMLIKKKMALKIHS